ncbi:MAG: alpha/beta hydrolase fold domain-containing protein, partial [Rhodothermales bacterium]|nr:alpha/beta hydrolase fold domain-containing protein [Rhodothermales bacterium]
MTRAPTSAARPADGPFQGRVSFADVAERIESIDLGDEPVTMRERFARLIRGGQAGQEPPVGTSETVGGVDTLVVPPPDGASGAARVVWFHGGGYVFGAPETHWRPAAALAAAVAAPVVLPRYRLAPEHPWPAPLDDALAVARALQDVGHPVAFAGDSAGGHLALVAALTLAREGRPVTALALFSPNTDRTGLSDTRAAHSDRDPMNDAAQDRALAALAFGARPYDHPQASPVLDDLALLPSTHVEVGDREVLLG